MKRVLTPSLIAEAVRCAAEAYYPRCKTLRNRCAVVSIALGIRLVEAGEFAAVVEGIYTVRRRQWRHCWVECGGLWYDLTRTQFHREADKVSILPPGTGGYMAMCRTIPVVALGLCVTGHETRAAERIADAARLE